VAISGFTIFDAIVIGTIRVDDLQREFYTWALTVRYGMLNRLQFQVRVPFLYRRDEELLAVGTSEQQRRTTDGLGLSDIEATASWQALIGRRALPGVVLRLRGRFPTGRDPFEIDTAVIGEGGQTRLKDAPTGSGFYAINPSLTLVWRSDPVALFLGGGYTFNLERDVGKDFGDINPGDTIEAFAGMNIALSERVSVNITFVDQSTGRSEQNGTKIDGTSFNDARLILGTSIGVGTNVSLLVSAAAGLTDQSPDFQFTVSLPLTWKLF
jgi:hypothetical protein